MPSQKLRDLTDIRNGSDEVRTHNHHHEDGTCCCGHHHHEHGDECGHEHGHEPEHKHGHDEACSRYRAKPLCALILPWCAAILKPTAAR